MSPPRRTSHAGVKPAGRVASIPTRAWVCFSMPVACVATGYLAWRLWLRGTSMLAAGETTAQLKFTLAYLTFGMGALMALTAFAFLVLMFRRPSRQSTGEV